MSDNDIKPVAWTSELQLYLVREQGYGTMASDDRHWSIALYDQSAIDQLTAERDALRADAERYRWLREFGDSVPDVIGPFGAGCHHIDGWLDAAIDAARAQEREG